MTEKPEETYKAALDVAAHKLSDSEFSGLVQLCANCVTHRGCDDEGQSIAGLLKKLPGYEKCDPMQFARGVVEYLFNKRDNNNAGH